MNIRQTIKEYTWLIILAGVVVSFAYPAFGMAFESWLPYLLMALMFFSAVNIPFRDIVRKLRKVKKLFFVLAIIHLASPLLIVLFRPWLSDDLFLGMILASVISSGMSVVFLSDLYDGNAADAMVITSVSNIFSPVTVPFLVFLFANARVDIDPISMSLTMVKFVIVPVVAAAAVRRTPLAKPCKAFGTNISLSVLFLLIVGIVSPVRDVMMDDIRQSLILGVMIAVLIVINFVLGYFTGKDREEKIAFALSASFKNFTLATVTAFALFSPLVALPAVLYTVVNNVLLIPMQFFFSKRKTS